MVEFVLVLPILILIVGGIIEFGHFYSTNEAIINAARDGARYASLHPAANTSSSPAAATTVQGQVIGAGAPASLSNTNILVCYYYGSSSSTPTTNTACPSKGAAAPLCGWYSTSAGKIVDATNADVTTTCAAQGNSVDVSIAYTVQPLSGLLHAVAPNGFNSNTDAMMVVECNPSGC